MIEVKVKSWKQMSIKDYFGLQKILSEAVEASENSRDIAVSVAAYLCGCSENELLNMRMTEFNRILSDTDWVYKDMKRGTPAPTYIIDGEKYDVCLDMRNCSTSQYIDYDIYSKNMKENYANMLACLLIPRGKKYGEGYDPVVFAEKLNNCFSIEDAENIFYFFALASKRLFTNTLRSLMRKMKRSARKEKDEVKKVKMLRTIVHLNTQLQFIDGLDL